MRKIITVVLLVFALFQSGALLAQDLLKGTDLSTVKVDYLSDSDIAKIKTQLQNNNTTIEQVEPLVLAKGMSATEYAKLKVRLGSTVSASPTGVSNTDVFDEKKGEQVGNKKK